MKYALALVAVAGVAGAAYGQATTLFMEASVDNGPWSSTVTANPGQSVKVRLSAQYTSGPAVTGLAGFNAKMQVTNWASGVLDPWGTPVSLQTGVAGGVPIGQNGRAQPFGVTSLTSNPTVTNGATLTLGGPTSTRLPFSQGPLSSNATWFNYSGSGATATDADTGGSLFQFSFVVAGAARSMVASVFDVFNSAAGNVKWYTGSGTATTANHVATLQSCTINVEEVPAPGALALMGLGGLVAARRRRA